jgi:hypothetical protein
VSREELMRALKNAKTDIGRKYFQDQLDKWDGLENIIADKYSKGAYQSKPKPKGKVDARSHKHAFQDATFSGSGIGAGIPMVGTVVQYVVDNDIVDVPELLQSGIDIVPMWAKLALLLLGAGWWLMVYVATLERKRNMEF